MNSESHGEIATSVWRGKSFFQKSKTRFASSMTAEASTAHSADRPDSRRQPAEQNPQDRGQQSDKGEIV